MMKHFLDEQINFYREVCFTALLVFSSGFSHNNLSFFPIELSIVFLRLFFLFLNQDILPNALKSGLLAPGLFFKSGLLSARFFFFIPQITRKLEAARSQYNDGTDL